MIFEEKMQELNGAWVILPLTHFREEEARGPVAWAPVILYERSLGPQRCLCFINVTG